VLASIHGLPGLPLPRRDDLYRLEAVGKGEGDAADRAFTAVSPLLVLIGSWGGGLVGGLDARLERVRCSDFGTQEVGACQPDPQRQSKSLPGTRDGTC
jgi:hypothetical protein